MKAEEDVLHQPVLTSSSRAINFTLHDLILLIMRSCGANG